MHRIFYIIMSFTLVLATTGLSISKHYCGDSLIRTNLGIEAKSCMPGMDMDSGCCDEKTETLVVDDDFQLSKSEIKFTPEYDLLIAYLVSEIVSGFDASGVPKILPKDTGPPVETEPLYLTVRSLLL